MRLLLQSVLDQPLIDLSVFQHHVLLRRKESDIYLLELLNLAIDAIEKKTDLSLRRKTWKLIHDNCFINLVKGPVQKILSIKSVAEKKDITPTEVIRNGDNLSLFFEDSVGKVSIIYEAGYTSFNLPICLKNSIIEMFWKLYSLNEEKLEETFQNYDLFSSMDDYFMGICNG